MTYVAIMSVVENRVAKYAEFEKKADALAHAAAHGKRWPDAFAVKAPAADVSQWWVDGRTVTFVPPEQPRRTIRKSLVEQRLRDVGKMGAAFALLMQNPDAWTRWYSHDHAEIFADDPDALALLKAIGADAEAIMAANE